MPIPSIFNYLDYRQYFKEAIAALQKSEDFSYREFARKAGYTSPNLLQMILAGKRKLNLAYVEGTAKVLGLGKPETEFFRNLVCFNEAKTQARRDEYYRRLSRSHTFGRTRVIDKDQYEFASRWYNPVVRELLVHPEYPGDPAWIAGRTEPAITAAQVEKSIAAMQNLGLIEKDRETGKWKQTDTSISTPAEVRSLAIKKYHQEMLQLAGRALDKIPPEARDIRGCTIGVSAARFPELKHRLTAFWEELLRDYADQTGPEEVYQLNMQFFPLTKKD